MSATRFPVSGEEFTRAREIAKKSVQEILEMMKKAENPAEHFYPTDILPEPLGQDVIDAMGGLNCSDCYENSIEESHENLIAWKILEGSKADSRYMLSQIERLTWEGHQLRRALIANGANMDEIRKMTNNEAWMATKKEDLL